MRRAVAVLALAGLAGCLPPRANVAPATVSPGSPTRGTIAAGIAPGDIVRANLLATYDSVGRRHAPTVMGRLVDIDTAGVMIRVTPDSVRRVPRRELEALLAYRGLSRGKGALVGYLVAVLASSPTCAGKAPECTTPVLFGVGGAIIGSIRGWPSWNEVHLP